MIIGVSGWFCTIVIVLVVESSGVAMQDNKSSTIKVWDLLVRVFHWALVLFFLIAYVTAEELDLVHAYAGYTILGLLTFRLLWGLIGTRFARFKQFMCPPQHTSEYLKSMLSNTSPRYLGHNPAGGYAVLALIVSVAMTALLGMALYATEGGGPWADSFIAGFNGDWLEDIHEFFANWSVLLIGFHVLGVLVSSFKHRENLVRSMWIGTKHRRPGDIE